MTLRANDLDQRCLDAVRELLGKTPLYARAEYVTKAEYEDSEPEPPVHWARGYWTRDGLGKRRALLERGTARMPPRRISTKE